MWQRRFWFSLALFTLLVPAFSYAQSLVPCTGPDCQACDITTLIQNGITFLVSFGTLVSTILIAWTGFQMVLEGTDNPFTHSALRNRLKSILIGFILMLGAWIIVDTVLKLFLNDSFLQEQKYGAWNKIQCVPQPRPTSTRVSPGVSTATTTVTSPGGVPVAVPGCAECVSLAALGMSCKAGIECMLKPAYAEKLSALNQSYPLRITEAYPPTATHSNPCHPNATCVDATLLSGMSDPDAIITFMRAASDLGIRAVYEGMDCTVRTYIRSSLGATSAYCISDSGYAHITGTHFSLYP